MYKKKRLSALLLANWACALIDDGNALHWRIELKTCAGFRVDVIRYSCAYGIEVKTIYHIQDSTTETKDEYQEI